MARSRNIKPAFFDNDELAELPPLARLLFIGMWTIADFKGDFEWREKRVKAKLLPYDNCDIKKLAINLDNSGFIRFYSDGGVIYCNVVNFGAHQNPHKNEKDKGSDIPEFTEIRRQAVDLKGLTINRDKNGLSHDKYGTNRADSLNLIPDSFKPIPDSPASEKEFELIWEMYGKKGNRKTSLERFNRMKVSDKKLMAEHLPRYVESTPDKQYRKGLEVYINKECWNDEVITNEKTTTDNRNYETPTDRSRKAAEKLRRQQQAYSENTPLVQTNDRLIR
jgi:hypothetical protein